MPQDQDLKQVEERMQKAVDALKKDLASMRAGRASPSLLEKVHVNYYGTPTQINQVANITVPEPRLLVVQPWDRNMIPDIEKAILKSDLGLNPSSDGSVIRIVIPQLTQERRQELVKTTRKKVEEARVAVRNIRREANDDFKKREKAGEFSEDEARKLTDKAQKLTDKYIEAVDNVLTLKEKEILEG